MHLKGRGLLPTILPHMLNDKAKLDFFPTNKWIYKYLGRRRRNIFTVMVLLQKKRAVLARPTQKSATQRAAKNTHKSPFRPSLQRIERWHIVQPLNFVVTKSHGAGKLLTCLHSSAASSLHSLHACVHGNVACHPCNCCTLGPLSNHLGC